MPYLFSSLLFAISASLDAFIVGITYGIRKIHINIAQNLIISIITLAGTVISILLGSWLAPFFPAQAAKAAGSIMLAMLGLYYIIKFMICAIKKYLYERKITENEIQKTSEDAAHNQPEFTLKEIVALGIALSVNNMGIGIGASIAGLSLLPTAVITLLLSVCLLALGNCIGKVKFLRMADKYADPLSGILLIGLGIYEWFC